MMAKSVPAPAKPRIRDLVHRADGRNQLEDGKPTRADSSTTAAATPIFARRGTVRSGTSMPSRRRAASTPSPTRFTGTQRKRRARARARRPQRDRAPSADAASKPRDAAIASTAPNRSNNARRQRSRRTGCRRTRLQPASSLPPSPPANSPASPHPASSGGNSTSMQPCTTRRTTVIFPIDRVTGHFLPTKAMIKGDTGVP